MNNYKNVSSIILSGGKSTRMGKDKCDLLFNGETFLNWQILKFKQIGITDIIASGYRGCNTKVKIVKDDIMKGPISGIYLGLENIENDIAFVVSCDVPLLKVDTIKNIIDCYFENKADIVVLKHNDKIEPLIAVYSKKIITKAKEMLQADNYAVKKLLEMCKVHEISIDDREDEFLNINYEEDYKKIIAMNQ